MATATAPNELLGAVLVADSTLSFAKQLEFENELIIRDLQEQLRRLEEELRSRITKRSRIAADVTAAQEHVTRVHAELAKFYPLPTAGQ